MTKAKPFPVLTSDAAAEQFVAEADLSTCDWSDMKPARFEFAAKDARINMRLPADLLAAVKARAAREHIPYQRLIRRAIEAAVANLASAATAGRSGQEAGGDRTQPACPELVEG